MNFNEKEVYFSHSTSNLMQNERFGDTTLRLDCFGCGRGSNDSCEFGRNIQQNYALFSSNPSDDGCRLVLGLGPTPMLLSSEQRQIKESSASSMLFQASSSNESDSILKLGLSGSGNAPFFSKLEFSASAHNDVNPVHHIHSQDTFYYPVLDEGSTSAKQSGGYMPTLLFAPKMGTISSTSPLVVIPKQTTPDLIQKPSSDHSQLTFEASVSTTTTTNYSTDPSSAPSTIITSTANRPQSQVTKRCKHTGCTKGARGASGLCIGHGGGQRCHKPGCNKGAESRTAYCKAHGGGRRCEHLGCTKSAEGKTEYCIAHGGGRRCSYSGGCTKAARGKSGLCIRHGGGKRCKIEGCSRSAEGQAGLCISHGGGRRCQAPGCSKGAQGSTLFCKAHGGGKRCIFAGCNKGAEGSTPLCKGHGGGKRCMFDGGGICPKSVHGGTSFCVAHGGGKRCSVAGCTKSARGRTDCCVRHGGGKRCKVENCGKSAQGSTDFCKAHGGGKRCCWRGANGGEKCEKFARGKSGLCAAHTSLVHGKGDREGRKSGKEVYGSGGGMIGPGLFSGLVVEGGSADLSRAKNGPDWTEGSRVERSVVSDSCSDGSMQRPAKEQQTTMITPQVLVPPWMKSNAWSSYSEHSTASDLHEGGEVNVGGGGGFELGIIPEGRVHGGVLMSLLGGNLSGAINGM